MDGVLLGQVRTLGLGLCHKVLVLVLIPRKSLSVLVSIRELET